MKRFKNIVIIVIMLMCVCNVSLAHGGNVTGWKDKNSKNVTGYNGKYYGYHKEDGKKHYHQVKWDNEKQRWIIIAPAIYYDENFNKIEKVYNEDTKKIEVELVTIVDGDTAKFKMNGENITVRFLGINTKETVDPEIGEEPWGKEGSNFTKEKLKNAKKIEMELDSCADEKDKYNRYLAWIWVDDMLLQNMLVENGLAETYMLQNNYKYAGMLQESEENAKNNKLGIWSEETNSIQKNEETSVENNDSDIQKEELIYTVLSILIVLIMSMLSISQKKRKRK